MKNKEYVIEKVSDLLKIPEDRIDACLDELKGAIKSAHAMKGLLHAVDKSMNGQQTLDVLLPRIIWRDDVERKLTFNFVTPPSQEGSYEDKCL